MYLLEVGVGGVEVGGALQFVVMGGLGEDGVFAVLEKSFGDVGGEVVAHIYLVYQ